VERNVNAPETFSGSESLEHPSKETKAEGVRRFKANPDFLLREVPVWLLSCLPDQDAVDLPCREIWGDGAE